MGPTAIAQTIWDGGGGNSNWSTANNWNNNIAPGNPSGSILNFAGVTRLTPNMDANRTVNGISFTNGAGLFTLGSTGGFTLTIASSSGVVNLDNSLQTVSSAVTLGAAQTWTTGANGGNLAVSGNVDTGGFTLSTNPSTNAARLITLSGAISGSGGVTVGGLGNTTFSGGAANTFTGTTTINSGILNLSKTANVTAIAGNIVIGDGAGTDTLRTTTANQISSTSALTFTAGGTPSFNLNSVNQTVGSISSTNTSANITLGTATLTVGGDNLSTSYAGTILGGTGGVVKNGTGTLTISGANTYTGATTINAGTLSISSEANLGANPGAFNAAQLTLDGGTLNTTATFAIDDTNRGVTVGASGGTFNTATGTTLNIAGIIGGSGTLTKTGSGTLINSGAGFNTHTGPIAVTSGILQFAKIAAVGAIDNIAAVSVASGASLQFNNSGAYTIETIGNISGAGTIESVGTTPINLKVNNDNLSSTFSGQINSTTDGNLELWKMGTGNLTLSNTTSNYSGQTEIQAGTLTISSIGNLGVASSVGAPTTVANGTIAMGLTSAATLAYTGTGHTTDRLIDLAGTTTGATLEASGSGPLVFTSAFTATGAGSKTLTLAGTSAAANTIQGAIVDNSGANTTSLVKSGAGTWVLSGTNTYTGTTTVNAGTLSISSEANLGANPGAFNAAQLTLDGGTLNTTATFAIDDSNRGITLGSSGGTFDTNPSTTLTVANVITGSGALTKTGTGNLTLTTANTFTGAVAINAGKVIVQSNNAFGTGTAGTTVASGAVLQIDGGRLTTSNGNLALAGAGIGGTGALIGAGGNNRWNGNITLTGNTTVSTSGTGYLALGITTTAHDRPTLDPLFIPPSDPTTLALGGNTLTLNGTTSAGDNRAIYVNARITGTGNVVVNLTNPADIVRYTANMNTYTGTTTIENGTLSLRTLYNTYPGDPVSPNYFGINGPIVIGDGVGAANTARLQMQAGTLYDELINFTSTVTLKQDGQWSLLSAQSIDALTFNGGAIDLGTSGSLFLNNTVTVNASAGNTATISGTGTSELSLAIHNGPAATRTFNVVGGVGNTSDLTISAKIKNGSIVKTGDGTMTITSDNSLTGYAGTTTVSGGILNIQHGGALGLADGSNLNSTTVNSGGTLQLQGGITVNDEKLTLNGNGFGGIGALNNKQNNNTYNGAIVLATDSRIQSDAGLLTLPSSITSSSNRNLEVRGAGNTTISGAIGTGSGGLTKNDSGTLTLSGSNTFGGATTINGGVVNLRSSTGLGSTGGGTTVNSGAELQIDNTLLGGSPLITASEPLTIFGTGTVAGGNAGALRNVSGNNTFQGAVTVGTGGALVTSNSGTSLTLSGGTTSSNQNLTIGTAAQNGNITISGNMTNGTGGLIKNGTGSLTIASTSTQTATVGQVQLNAGNMNVGTTGYSNTLNATDFDSAGSTTLTIASGGMVNVAQAAASTSSFAGAMAGAGEFKFTGADLNTSILALTNSFNASSLTLTLGGGTLALAGGGFTFGTINITGDTILDFGNSAGTFLSSATLNISSGVQVTVKNWVAVANQAANSTVWYATNTITGIGTLGGSDIKNVVPLTQITFQGWDANTYPTTWVSGNHDGWFDREIRPTPEPATYGALLISGCLGLLGWRRYRNRQKATAASLPVSV